MEKSNSGLWAGVLLLVVGGFWLFNNLGIFRFDFGEFMSRAWPLAIIIVGVYLLFGAKRTTSASQVPGAATIKQALGDMEITPDAIGPEGLIISLSAGEVKLDLTETRLQDGENLVEVKLGLGDVQIKVPKAIPTSVEGKTGVGDLHVLGNTRDGFAVKVEHKDDGFAESGKRLHIIAAVGLGDIRISRG